MSSVSENYNLEGQNPLDIKVVSPNKESLILKIQNDEFMYYRFYANMKVFFQQENEEWIWVEIINDYSGYQKLLAESYTYPAGTIAYGFDYSGKTFNFIKYSDYLQSGGINEGLISGLESEGVGVDLQNGLNRTTNNFKIPRAQSSDSSIVFEKKQDGSLDAKAIFPVINGEALAYTIEEPGINIFKKLQDKKLQFLPLIGENLAIVYLYSGDEVVGIKIGNPSSFQFRTFYVNANYPFNDGNGTIGKPYRTFAECYNEYVSPTESNPNRPGENYNRAYPKNRGARIIIQSAITTNINPSINQMVFENTEGFTFTYTGDAEYMFDTEEIYPLIDKVGTVLKDSIYFRIIGKGNFRRTDDINRGLVRCWGSNRTNDPNHNSSISSIDIGDGLSDLKFIEGDPVFTGKTFIDMQAYVNGSLVNLQSVYGSEYKATTDNLYLPSINKSLFNIQYRNTGPDTTFAMDGKTTIQSFSQTSFYSKNCLLNLNGQIYHAGFTNYVAYNGTTNYDTISPTGLSWLRYVPHTGKYQFQFDDDSLIYCKGFYMDERAGFGHYGWDAAIYASKTAVFKEFICRHFSQTYYNSFVKLTSDNDSFALGTGGAGILSEILAPNAQYLISGGLSGTGQNINCFVANTTIYSYKDLKPTSSLSKVIFNTRGTLLSLKGRPVISGIESFANATVAESNGIVTGGLFKDASKSNNINSL